MKSLNLILALEMKTILRHKIKVAVLLLIFVCDAAIAEEKKRIEPDRKNISVSFFELLGDGKNFDGKSIQLFGFGRLMIDGNFAQIAVFPTSEQAQFLVLESAFLIHIDFKHVAEIERLGVEWFPMQASGLFTARSAGQWSLFSRVLENGGIEVYESTPDPKNPRKAILRMNSREIR